ncbi:hypothetical protein H6P81_003471 [Aristolochia fimbriata]|uniref:Uncharacterized protein n=1 Tax=Aristolochia fimbriata TaxID=158543 RepID=A0AAV7FCV4_ARIFI|nr:hypothetical protein H6P81_003471 [Aristolochia fimbriata]
METTWHHNQKRDQIGWSTHQDMMFLGYSIQGGGSPAVYNCIVFVVHNQQAGESDAEDQVVEDIAKLLNFIPSSIYNVENGGAEPVEQRVMGCVTPMVQHVCAAVRNQKVQRAAVGHHLVIFQVLSLVVLTGHCFPSLEGFRYLHISSPMPSTTAPTFVPPAPEGTSIEASYLIGCPFCWATGRRSGFFVVLTPEQAPELAGLVEFTRTISVM